MRNISRDSPIGSAIANGNWGYITQRMQDRFDCEFNEANVAESLEAERLFIASRGTKDFGAGWKDSTWMIWLKNRIEFNSGCPVNRWQLRNRLNFFFITIPEDSRMIDRLRNETVMYIDTTARSKISSTQHQSISPVNHTASLVVRET